MSRQKWLGDNLTTYEAKTAACDARQAAQQQVQERILTSGHHPTHLAFGAEEEDPDTHLPATFERTRAGAANGTTMGNDGYDASNTQDREAMRSANDGMNGHPDPMANENRVISSRDYDIMHRLAPFPSSSIAPPGVDGARQISVLQSKLQQRLGPEYISSRQGPAQGPKVHYIEGWKAFDLANEVFGFNGWSSEIKRLEIDFVDILPEGRVNVGVSVILRVTLRDGTYHEDVGYGHMENAKGKGAALEKAKKEAVTDAFKRSLKSFGRLLGNCTYDKKFLAAVSKMKAEEPKFELDKLKRAPDPRALAKAAGDAEPKAASYAPASESRLAPPPVEAGPSSRPAPIVEQQTSPAKRAATTPAITSKPHPKHEANRLEALRRKEEAQRQRAEAEAREAARAEADSSMSGPSTTAHNDYAAAVEQGELPPPSQAFRDMDESALDEMLSSIEASTVAAPQQQATFVGDSSYIGHDDSGVALPSFHQHVKGPQPSALSTAVATAPSRRDRTLDSSSPPPIVKPEPQAAAEGVSTNGQQLRRAGSRGRFTDDRGSAAKAPAAVTHGTTSLSNVAGGRSATTSGVTSRSNQMLPPQQRSNAPSMAGQYGAVAPGVRPGSGSASKSTRGTAASYNPQHGASSNGNGFRTALQETGAINGLHNMEPSALKKPRLS